MARVKTWVATMSTRAHNVAVKVCDNETNIEGEGTDERLPFEVGQVSYDYRHP